MPWSADAFARARREDKPILLDVGAVWCHWCHVMDRESYENETTAAIVNRLFVPVKVDRDERPDVDARYQKAVQAMTGQGGWPLTAFLLPDGRCFYGGTYFPPADAHGRPSFTRVLEAVAAEFRDRREKVLAGADDLQDWLAKRTAPAAAPAPRDAWPSLLEHGALHVLQDADLVRGGFGSAPKFPHPTATDLSIGRGDARARDVVLLTLERMRGGGVYDQLAGGFHRYSVDAEWIVPHFEKMLYDNAGLLRNYARAGAAFQRPGLVTTAREIVGFLRDVLQRPEGGFGGSQDADIDLEDDGDHFTWTLDELRAAVAAERDADGPAGPLSVPDEALTRLMAQRFGVREKGDMHHDPKRCVLRIDADVEALAVAHHRSLAQIEADLARGMQLMRAARATRKTPFVDPTRYVNWNGMAIQALLEHAGLHGDREAEAMALRALDALLATTFETTKGFSRTPGSSAFGLLDDNAQMLDALIEAHFATGEDRYLLAARATADLIVRAFPHEAGGFADRAPSLAPPAVGPLALPERPIQDAPTASANGVAVRALLRLAEASGEERYRAEALRALDALAPEAARLALFGGALLLALHEALVPPPRVVVKGDVRAFRAVARAHAGPGATLLRATDAGAPEEARLLEGDGALVCLGTRCLAPARTPEELEERLTEARRAKPQIPP